MHPRERDVVAREIRRTVEERGFWLFDLRISQGRVAHVFIDRDGPRIPVDEMSRLNYAIRDALVAINMDVDIWSIEIESPGADCALRTPAHFAWFVGERIRVVRRDPTAPHHISTGLLVDATATGIRFEPEPARKGPPPQPIEIPFTDIASARLDPKLPF